MRPMRSCPAAHLWRYSFIRYGTPSTLLKAGYCQGFDVAEPLRFRVLDQASRVLAVLTGSRRGVCRRHWRAEEERARCTAQQPLRLRPAAASSALQPSELQHQRTTRECTRRTSAHDHLHTQS